MASKLAQFEGARDRPFAQNRLLFDWLCDDQQRTALYAELRQDGRFPLLHFKSMQRSAAAVTAWPDQDVFLVSARSEVSFALQHFSVEPYATLESGGRFMLGLDDIAKHRAQREIAARALCFDDQQIARCAEVAFERAAVQPLKQYGFDLVALAEQAALQFSMLLFGLPDQAHTRLQLLLKAVYRRLTFQIIGRHFVANAGLPPSRLADADKLKTELEDLIREARTVPHADERRAKKLPPQTVVSRLYQDYGSDPDDEVVLVTIGLIAGTIGNVRAAVAIALNHFFNMLSTPGAGAGRLLETARAAAWRNDDSLQPLIEAALLQQPPAAFLARTACTPRAKLQKKDWQGQLQDIPEGAHLLLAVGADPDPGLLFGGQGLMHSCVGRHLAQPLVERIVREVLRLPGLGQAIDADTGKARGLVKRWGASCESYPLQYRRDRCLNQQPLFVVLPIKAPVAENARKLEALTRAGAHIIEEALRDSQHVHFAWFSLVENRTHLAMMTAYDGNFDAYVEHFAVKVSLFDDQFKYLDVEQQTPIRDHPKQFVDNIRKHNRPPLGDYFFSAYPLVSVAEIRAAAGLP